MSEVESGIEYRKGLIDYKIAGDTVTGVSEFGCRKDGTDLAIKVVVIDDIYASAIHCQVDGEEKAWKLIGVDYYFGVTITPEYVETDPGDDAKTGTFEIAVQAYNYGTGDLPDPVEGISYVNKKEGTQSWWWYDNGLLGDDQIQEWREETINPNLVPPGTWEYEYIGEAVPSVYPNNFISDAYVLYKVESVFDLFTFVEGGGGLAEESGVYIKDVSAGDLSDDHVFLIIKVTT